MIRVEGYDKLIGTEIECGTILSQPRLFPGGRYRCLVRSHYNELLLVELSIFPIYDHEAKGTPPVRVLRV